MGLGVPTRHKWVKCSYYISHFMFNENSYRINEIPQKKKARTIWEISSLLSRDILCESHFVSAFLSWRLALDGKYRNTLSMMRLVLVSRQTGSSLQRISFSL